MKGNRKSYAIVGGVVLSLIVIFFLAIYAVPRILVSLTKAAPAYKVSIANSKLIGEKILARADGTDKNIVNVFVMDSSDKGVPGKGVTLTGIDNIQPVIAKTDNSGKASFSMVSTTEQQYELSASVDGVRMPTTIKVTFRND